MHTAVPRGECVVRGLEIAHGLCGVLLVLGSHATVAPRPAWPASASAHPLASLPWGVLCCAGVVIHGAPAGSKGTRETHQGLVKLGLVSTRLQGTSGNLVQVAQLCLQRLPCPGPGTCGYITLWSRGTCRRDCQGHPEIGMTLDSPGGPVSSQGPYKREVEVRGRETGDLHCWL